VTLLERVSRTVPPPDARERAVHEAASDIRPRAFRIGIAFALVLGGGVRLRALSSDFPLSDGGLFYAMTRNLQASHYRLPDVTTYNNAHIPFAYPPLGFYLTGLLDDATPMSLLSVYRVLPFAFSMLSILAFVWLAAAFLPSRRALLVASIAFALFPLSYRWMIMGGGVTRAPALVLAMLALRIGIDMYREGRIGWRVGAAGALAGLALLSHLETGYFLAFSLVLFASAIGRRRLAFVQCAVAGGVAVVIAAPWWATVLAKHGTDPFIAAARTGQWSYLGPITALFQIPKAEPQFGMITALALLGALFTLVNRRYLLAGWILLAATLDPRAFPNFASIPVAVLAAIGVCEVLLPLARGALAGAEHPRSGARRVEGRDLFVGTATLAVLVVALVSSFSSFSRVLTGMTPEERGAMSWTAANTPADARVLVISGDDWSVDRTAEWFPALTGRTSAATVQGYEWVDGGVYRKRNEDALALRKCAAQEIACVDAWAAKRGVAYDYIYLPKIPHREEFAFEDDDCCGGLRVGLRSDSRYTTVYDGPGASIFRLKQRPG
jgi:hypothetical protein